MGNPFESRIDQARIFLRVALLYGERPADVVMKEAFGRGIKRATLTLARQREGITTTRRNGRWYWQRPKS